VWLAKSGNTRKTVVAVMSSAAAAIAALAWLGDTNRPSADQQQFSGAAQPGPRSETKATEPMNTAPPRGTSSAQADRSDVAYPLLAASHITLGEIFLRSEGWAKNEPPFDNPYADLRSLQTRGLAGDATAARLLADLANRPWDFYDPRDPAGTLNMVNRRLAADSSVNGNTLYWLEHAAAAGHTQAKLTYAYLVQTMPSEIRAAFERHEPEALLAYEQRARAFHLEAAKGGIADSYFLMARAHQHGVLGLAKNPTKAHACLLLHNAAAPTQTTAANLVASAKGLRAGDLVTAHTLAMRPASCFE
jgi:TPR repeat protein